MYLYEEAFHKCIRKSRQNVARAVPLFTLGKTEEKSDYLYSEVETEEQI